MTDDDTTESQYPEHALLKAARDSGELGTIQRFVDWLDEEPEAHPQVVKDDNGNVVAEIAKPWRIAMYYTFTHGVGGQRLPQAEWYEDRELMTVRPRKEQIIGLFLGIDPNKLEKEKVQMLEECRRQHENRSREVQP